MVVMVAIPNLPQIAAALSCATETEKRHIRRAVEQREAISGPSVAMNRWRRRCRAQGRDIVGLQDLRAAAAMTGGLDGLLSGARAPGVGAARRESLVLERQARELGLVFPETE